MKQEPNGPTDTPLSSAEYRERLMRKLNCLISVLEVATKKIERSLRLEGSDVERLTRIQSNLQETMDVCLRARKALERKSGLPEDLRERLARVANEPALNQHTELHAVRRPPPVEVGSAAELERFRDLGRIGAREIEACDFDDLARRLQG